MVDWNLVRERFRAYRRNFRTTWVLFKESRIGVAGLGIIVVFSAIAILGPYMGLRDPIFWRAPSEDLIDLRTNWATDTSTFLFDAGGPIESEVAIRLVPRTPNPPADRVYVASGDKLLAVDPRTGLRGWNRAFQTSATITAGPIAVNFGDHIDPRFLDEYVFVGTADGTFYALNDTSLGGETGTPGGSAVTTLRVTGSVTSIAAYSDFYAGYSPWERVYVGTSEGYLYAFRASNMTEVWNRTFGPGIAVRMAGTPLNPPSKLNYSAALTENGTRIFLNAGMWYGLYTENGTFAWPQPYSVGTPWTSAPVVGLPGDFSGGFGEIVYAASDDGWLLARLASTGDPYSAWQASSVAQLHPSGVKAIPVMRTASQRDPGPLFQPYIDGGTIFAASQSGILYAITRDAFGTEIAAGSVLWRYSDAILVERGFGFSAPPVFRPDLGLVFAPGSDPAGTTDPTDDMGVLFAIGEAGGLVWRKDFDAPVRAPPSIWVTQEAAQLVPSLWIGSSDGWVFSLSSTGIYLAPLPPGTYPSGNTYVWGTDNQGRDILSQFIWGSRIALIVGFASALLGVGIGLVVGLVSGYVGRKTDVVLMRFTDVVLVLPTLPLLIILSAILGASIWNVVLVIALLSWPGTARVIRAEILSLKERPYIHSARVTGASSMRIMFRHLTPNVMPLVFLYMTFSVSGAILFEAALSFLGLGDINTPSWGTMLSTIQQSDLIRAYWWLLPPGLGITLLSLAFFLVGRAFEQVVNPRLRTR